MAAWGEGCLAYYSWKVIITSALFTHTTYTAECITFLFVLCRKQLSPFPENEIFHSVPRHKHSLQRLRWKQPTKGCRSGTQGVQRTNTPEHGSCWIFSNPPSNVLCQQLPQLLPALAPTDFPGCLLREWGLSIKERSTSRPRLDFVKRLKFN